MEPVNILLVSYKYTRFISTYLNTIYLFVFLREFFNYGKNLSKQMNISTDGFVEFNQDDLLSDMQKYSLWYCCKYYQVDDDVTQYSPESCVCNF